MLPVLTTAVFDCFRIASRHRRRTLSWRPRTSGWPG